MPSQSDSNLKRLMLLMNRAFEDCSVSVDPLEVERFAQILYQVMSARYRIFHTVEHIFMVAEDAKGPGVFAALFHDIVYHQVDRRIHPLLTPYQHELVIDEESHECILPDLKREKWLAITGRIFGFKSGQTLGVYSGLNEFLSALTAARMFKDLLAERQIVQIIASIEATIPFRSQESKEKDPFEQLRQRLSEVNRENKWNMSEQELDAMVKMSIQLANQDICSFYSKNFGEFISGTWNLILENNPIFNNPLYTVVEYRKALQKVHGFFSTLKVDHVVHQWGGVPSPSQFSEMKKQVSENLMHAILYLDIRLMAIGVLEAIAISTGGDAPYFLLIGESSEKSPLAPIERYLSSVDFRVNKSMNEVVLYVLKQGRDASSSFDFNHSPVAAYLYEHSTAEEVSRSIALSRDFYDGKIDSKAFLGTFSKKMIEPIIRGVEEISWSRRFK